MTQTLETPCIIIGVIVYDNNKKKKNKNTK